MSREPMHDATRTDEDSVDARGTRARAVPIPMKENRIKLHEQTTYRLCTKIAARDGTNAPDRVATLDVHAPCVTFRLLGRAVRVRGSGKLISPAA